mmetsp:Transcript_5058/g.9316  ORF Transcript_5058/g.9316 Transcript_5058/m.9316 type:complete len:376 (-) Transcript_5058:127-1254(-)|eukprot:CAMPEP_0197541392 /NCGR_PEP_ID=MMETSP1318-20131121/67133_1 /TAXON_ID=552666 /ORGANISM="Partenskyella glossopodia, Strain RCC365" /LENGTH=375 /DNA_ID=CAMNT_0043100559 /DNA_START=54 /DNA_END=1181 /DNA_ORIENTATION=+
MSSSLKITVSVLAALAALACLRSVHFASSEHSSLGVGVAVRQAAAVSSPRCAQMPARGRFNAALRGLGKQQQQQSSSLGQYHSQYHNHHQTSAARWVSSWASARDVRVNAEIAPAIIIGGGRVGQALKEMGSGGDVILGRNDPFPENAPAGPIFVATRNDALDGVIEKVPASRREDLVFMQNGYLQEYLNKKGLPDATQVLVYFAVAKLGEKPTDGITDMNPEGLTAANGKWAQAAADRFHNAGLSCKVLDKTQFERAMFEKLIWISSFMLVGARHPGATVGDVESKHTQEVSDLIEELAKAVPGVDFAPQVSERLCAYARSVAHFPTAVKEFEWRNGFFNKLSVDSYMSGNKVDPCPIHSAYLAEIGQGTPLPA